MDTFAKVVDPIFAHIVNPLILLMFAVAIIVFVWGVVQMMMNGDDSDARTKGRNHMLAGIVGITIMISAWGIIYFISNTISGR
ncbi:MAG: hypothetical protein PHG25_03205 [Candidatus Pacebacteria bacterium]|nr:hypothetical protein [Candidatus Paceibacterota bacterium]